MPIDGPDFDANAMSMEEISRELHEAAASVEVHTETITFAELTTGGYEEGHVVDGDVTPTGECDVTPTNEEYHFSGGQGK